MPTRITQLFSLIILGLVVLVMSSAQFRLQAQDSTPQAQATIDAAVQELFNATATAQIAITLTVENAFSGAQTATANASSPSAQATPTPAPVTDTSRLIAKDTLAIEMEEESPMFTFLAPNGEMFAYLNSRNLCLYTLTTQEQRCLEFELPRIDPMSVRWSPDSRSLVMNENFFRDFIDADIWVVDVLEETLTDLTDDGVGRITMNAEQDTKALIDVSPRWINNRTIGFIRYSNGESADFTRPALYSIQADGGNLAEIAPLETVGTFPAFVLALSPDGQYAAYNRYTTETDDDTDGLWVFEIMQNQTRPLYLTQENYDVPRELEFSPDSQFILAVDARLAVRSSEYDPAESPVRVYPINDGAPVLIDADHYVVAAGWSPDGHALAYLVQDPLDEGASGLYLSTEPGKPGRLVLPGRFMSSTGNFQTLVWATNNTILLRDLSEQRLLIIQLENEVGS